MHRRLLAAATLAAVSLSAYALVAYAAPLGGALAPGSLAVARSSNGIAVQAVSVAQPASGVPCFDCVHGTFGTIGLAQTRGRIPSGLATLEYDVSFASLTFSGTCTVSYAVSAGGAVLASGSRVLEHVRPHTEQLGVLAGTRPAYRGSARVTARVACGAGEGSVEAPLWFD